MINNNVKSYYPVAHYLYSKHFATDVHITLNGHMISNHGYVNVNDIGSETPNALLCHTNYDRADQRHSGGNWYGPDESRVLSISERYEPHGFHRNRGPGVVRLLRGYTDNPLFGIYRCTIKDADLIEQSVFAGIYNDSNGGIVQFLKVGSWC